MKITIEHEPMTVTIDDPSVVTVEDAVELTQHSLWALGYGDYNVACAMAETGQMAAEAIEARFKEDAQ